MAPLLGVVATLGYAPYGQWYLSLLALALMFLICARVPASRAAFSFNTNPRSHWWHNSQM